MAPLGGPVCVHAQGNRHSMSAGGTTANSPDPSHLENEKDDASQVSSTSNDISSSDFEEGPSRKSNHVFRSRRKERRSRGTRSSRGS
ncbi:Protein Jumonji, partial [Ophiophagus hannah]